MPDREAVEQTIDELCIDGTLYTLVVPEKRIRLDVEQLIGNRLPVSAHSSGTAPDHEDTMSFYALRDSTSEVETLRLPEAETAYRRMSRADIRFRAVLVP